MKLATVSIGARSTVVAQHGDALVDIAAVLGVNDVQMSAVVGDHGWRDRIAAVLAAPIPTSAQLRESDVVFEPPYPRPSKIVGVALNNTLGSQFAYRTPTEPAYFLKPTSALTAHRRPIVVPAEYGVTHPEPELAAVIGTRARNLHPKDALGVVFGYTIVNDITSPGLKDRDSMELVLPVSLGPAPEWRRVDRDDDYSLYLTYHARSKGCDTFAPMGPWITTADEVGDPNNLQVLGLLDGQPVLKDTTANLRFSVQTVLAHLSRYMTLEPGDIVHFGTAFMPADPDRFPNVRTIDISRLNGTLSVAIEGLGRLDNPIVHEPVTANDEVAGHPAAPVAP